MIKNRKLIYIEDYEELFVDIQTKKILKDQKSFVDSVPKFSVKEILDAYRVEKESANFNLKDFYCSHFFLNDEKVDAIQSFKNIEEHIYYLWDVLTKYPEEAEGTLIPLPEKFVVPGGRFREIFYWDSYFTMLGLQVSRRIDLIESMVNNFAYLIDEFGFIPNGNRTYFLTRSQPPFFSFMIELLCEEKGDEVLLKYLPQLEKEYAYWMKGEKFLTEAKRSAEHVVKMPGGEILNRYWDVADTPRPEGYIEDFKIAKKAHGEIYRHIRAAAESGWDFSSRWFSDAKNMETICTCEVIALDLNCLLLNLERVLQKGYHLKEDEENSKRYHRCAERRTEAIQKYLWSDSDKLFSDYNFLNNKLNRVANLSMTYPLVVKIATQKQAACVQYQLEKKFLQPGGLLSTLVNSGEQWDAPNGWAPLQWMAFRGMQHYGFNEFADKICDRWIKNIEQVFETKEKLKEKYNVVDFRVNASGGEYSNQDGFGWTNGVYLNFRKHRNKK